MFKHRIGEFCKVKGNDELLIYTGASLINGLFVHVFELPKNRYIPYLELKDEELDTIEEAGVLGRDYVYAGHNLILSGLILEVCDEMALSPTLPTGDIMHEVKLNDYLSGEYIPSKEHDGVEYSVEFENYKRKLNSPIPSRLYISNTGGGYCSMNVSVVFANHKLLSIEAKGHYKDYINKSCIPPLFDIRREDKNEVVTYYIKSRKSIKPERVLLRYTKSVEIPEKGVTYLSEEHCSLLNVFTHLSNEIIGEYDIVPFGFYDEVYGATHLTDIMKQSENSVKITVAKAFTDVRYSGTITKHDGHYTLADSSGAAVAVYKCPTEDMDIIVSYFILKPFSESIKARIVKYPNSDTTNFEEREKLLFPYLVEAHILHDLMLSKYNLPLYI